MKVSIGIFSGNTPTGLRLFRMIDYPDQPEYALPENIKVDLERAHLFKFSEQDQFCEPIPHSEYHEQLTK